ncbi:MAG TPA: 30S ribosomal protein S2 [Candidatus Bathyarchaeia archaeon]|nr:30S ribosomal protein S2 [Candidatus Bathyarchaeia archaeon]
MATKVTLKDLLEAGAHFGHQAKRWNPKMKPYLFGVRGGVHIFDLAKTKEGLEKAAAYIRKVTAQGGLVVFVGTKRQAAEIVKEEAQKAGMPYVCERWLGGTITNWEQIKKSLDKLEEMKEKRKKEEYKEFTKKENLLIDRKIARLERFLGGLVSLKGLPEAIFVVDTKKEETAVREAKQKEIAVVALVDSNADPDLIDLIIPVNDDAIGAVKLVVETIGQAAKEGRLAWEKKGKGKGKIQEKEAEK